MASSRRGAPGRLRWRQRRRRHLRRNATAPVVRAGPSMRPHRRSACATRLGRRPPGSGTVERTTDVWTPCGDTVNTITCLRHRRCFIVYLHLDHVVASDRCCDATVKCRSSRRWRRLGLAPWLASTSLVLGACGDDGAAATDTEGEADSSGTTTPGGPSTSMGSSAGRNDRSDRRRRRQRGPSRSPVAVEIVWRMCHTAAVTSTFSHSRRRPYALQDAATSMEYRPTRRRPSRAGRLHRRHPWHADTPRQQRRGRDRCHAVARRTPQCAIRYPHS